MSSMVAYMDWKTYFKGKKVTQLGLGLLGRGVGDAIFLAECGADLIVTDLRDKKTLEPSLAKLRKFKNIQYVFGEHRLEDFRNRDFILKAAGVPLESLYIAEARKNNIPVEMDASLFARLLTPERSDGGQAKLMPKGVILVGVTGTRGKSTTTALIYEILSSTKRFTPNAKRSVYKGGNLVPEATLPLLKKVRAGDIVVLELDSWQLQGFHDAKISPQVAVFTTFLDDHLVYYKGDTARYFEDKVAIFKYQKTGDVLVVGEQAAARVGGARPPVPPRIARALDVPQNWKIKIPGKHNLENIACALAAARALHIPDSVSKKAIERFKGVPGRLEYLRTVRGVKIYNDNNATTPDATIAGLKALSSLNSSFPKGGGESASRRIPNPSTRKNAVLPLGKGELRNIILIVGGTDKGLDMSKLVAEIPKHCKAVVMLKETGTDKLKRIMNYELARPNVPESARYGRGITIKEKEKLKECVEEAMKLAEKGDIILFSPAFASFGKWFKNEYDRGDQFVQIIRTCK